jgi:hypothetical protein
MFRAVTIYSNLILPTNFILRKNIEGVDHLRRGNPAVKRYNFVENSR